MSKAYSYLWTAFNGLFLATTYNNAQVDEAIKTKYLAKGHKHVGTSGARTRGLVHRSPALFHQTTRLGGGGHLYFKVDIIRVKKIT